MNKAFYMIGLLALVGCATTQAQYDIDVECMDEPGKFYYDFGVHDEQTRTIMCLKGGEFTFSIQCDRKTFHELENLRYCTTHDGKSVRVTLLNDTR